MKLGTHDFQFDNRKKMKTIVFFQKMNCFVKFDTLYE